MKQETAYLRARVGSTKKITNSCASDRSGCSRVTTLDSRDGCDGDLLLAKASFDVGNGRGDQEKLGDHGVVCVRRARS